MLKIKDDIDLKELEKYGFKKEPTKSYYYKEISEQIYIEVQIFKNDTYIQHKEININTEHGSFFNNLDLLYDLIKADLVEKV